MKFKIIWEKVREMPLPIDMDLLKKREEIPIKLAELSYMDPDSAVVLLRKWGEKKSPITVLHAEICSYIKKCEVKPNVS